MLCLILFAVYARVGDKKPIHQVEALPEQLQLVVVIQGALFYLFVECSYFC